MCFTRNDQISLYYNLIIACLYSIIKGKFKTFENYKT